MAGCRHVRCLSRGLGMRVPQAADVAATLPAMAEPSVRDPSAPPLRSRHPIPPTPPQRARPTRRPVDAEDDDAGQGPAGGGLDRRPIDRRRTDRRRLLAAIASSVLPGSGQVLDGRFRPALLFGVPTLAVIGIAWVAANSDA